MMLLFFLLSFSGNEVIPIEISPLDELSCSGVGRAVTAHGVTMILGVDPENSPSYTGVYGYNWTTQEAWEDQDLRTKAWFLGGITSTDQGFILFDNLSGQITHLNARGIFDKHLNWRSFPATESFFLLHEPWPVDDETFFATGDANGLLKGVYIDGHHKQLIELPELTFDDFGDRYIPIQKDWIKFNIFTKYIALLDQGFNRKMVIHKPSEVIEAEHRPSRIAQKIGKSLQVLKSPILCGDYITWQMRVEKRSQIGIRYNTVLGTVAMTYLIPVGKHNSEYLVFDLNMEELRVVPDVSLMEPKPKRLVSLDQNSP